MFNMGDDSADAVAKSWSPGKLLAFKQAAMRLGVDLDIEYTTNLEDVRLLSMGIRYFDHEASENPDFWSPFSKSFDVRAHDLYVFTKWRQWIQGIAVVDANGKVVKKTMQDIATDIEGQNRLKDKLDGISFIVYNSGTQAVMRQTAFKAYRASEATWAQSLVQGGVGLAQLFAFMPRYYHLAFLQYRLGIEAMNRLHPGIPGITAICVPDEADGLPVVLVVPKAFADHTNLTAAERGTIQTTLEEWLNTRNPPSRHEHTKPLLGMDFAQAARATKSLKIGRSLREWHFLRAVLKGQAQFPSYMKVVRKHMNLDDHEDVTFDNSKWRKFRTALDNAGSWDQKAVFAVDRTTRFIHEAIPDPVRRVIPSVPGLSPALPWSPPYDYIAENTCILNGTRNVAEADGRARESPFLDATNTTRWIEQYGSDDEFWFKLTGRDPTTNEITGVGSKPLIWASAQLLGTGIFYFILAVALEPWILRVPGLNVVYVLFCLWNFGLTRLYSLGNFIFYVGTGRSSREISSLQPRDPWVYFKRIAVFLYWLQMHYLGDICTYICLPFVPLVFLPFSQAIPEIFRIIRQFRYVRTIAPDTSGGANPWIEYTREILAILAEKRQMIVTSPTGSGKSTYFIVAILIYAFEFFGLLPPIIIAQPRNVLVNELHLPQHQDGDSHRLKIKKVSDRLGDPSAPWEADTNVFIATYQHLALTISKYPSEAIFIFDEFHEASGEMIELWAVILERRAKDPKAFPTIFLSATPVEVPGVDEQPVTFDAKIPARAKRHTKLREAADVLSQFNYATSDEASPELQEAAKKSLIVVPTVTKVMETSQHLAAQGLSVSELYRGSKAPDHSAAVIVATPIVNAGITLPGRDLVISTGIHFVVDEGIPKFIETDPIFEKQLDGRVGRGTKDGYILKPRRAGHGHRPIIYPSGVFFKRAMIAEFFKVPQLLPVDNPYFKDVPIFSVDESLPPSLQRGLAIVHLLNLAGIPESTENGLTWRSAYRCLVETYRPLPREHKWIEQTLRRRNECHTAHWDLVMAHLRGKQNVTYAYRASPGADVTFDRRGPIIPVQKTWVTSLPRNETIEVIQGNGTIEERYVDIIKEQAKFYEEALAATSDIDRQVNKTLRDCGIGGKKAPGPNEPRLKALSRLIESKKKYAKEFKNKLEAITSTANIRLNPTSIPRQVHDCHDTCPERILVCVLCTAGLNDEGKIEEDEHCHHDRMTCLNCIPDIEPRTKTKNYNREDAMGGTDPGPFSAVEEVSPVSQREHPTYSVKALFPPACLVARNPTILLSFVGFLAPSQSGGVEILPPIYNKHLQHPHLQLHSSTQLCDSRNWNRASSDTRDMEGLAHHSRLITYPGASFDTPDMTGLAHHSGLITIFSIAVRGAPIRYIRMVVFIKLFVNPEDQPCRSNAPAYNSTLLLIVPAPVQVYTLGLTVSIWCEEECYENLMTARKYK
nr:MAG: polyprotein [Rhizoctonia solani hypovirus 7]